MEAPAAKDMRLQGLGLAFFLWAVASGSVLSQGVSNGAPKPVVLLAEITGVIGPATAHYAERAIEQARARQAEALIFRLDTPGGLLTSTREIIKAVIASPVPIIGFVAPSWRSRGERWNLHSLRNLHSRPPRRERTLAPRPLCRSAEAACPACPRRMGAGREEAHRAHNHLGNQGDERRRRPHS